MDGNLLVNNGWGMIVNGEPIMGIARWDTIGGQHMHESALMGNHGWETSDGSLAGEHFGGEPLVGLY